MESAKKFRENERTLREERYGWFGKSVLTTFLLLAVPVIPVVLYRHRMARKQVSVMHNFFLQALLQSSQRFCLFAATVDLFIWTTNSIAEVDYANEKVVSYFGNELMGHSWLNYVHPDDMSRVYSTWKESVGTGVPWEIEMRMRSKTGEYRWLMVRARCMRDAQGKITRWFGAAADIDALLQSTERFRLLTAVVDMQIWTADSIGNLDYVNENCISFFGDPNLLRLSSFRYVHPDDLPRVRRLWEESIKTGEPYAVEARFRFRTGEYRWLLARARCMRDAQGKITRWFGAAADIDALKKAQQSALDANRAKDVFLATISHELRNPLNPALLVASEEAENPELPEPVRSSFNVILNNIELESRLIDDLLDLTRISAGKLSLRMQLVDVHKIFEDAMACVQSDQVSKHISLAVDWRAQKNEVNGDPLRLRQIFWNILKNAVKFTPPDGTVRVNASNADSHVIIKVTDSGIGH